MPVNLATLEAEKLEKRIEALEQQQLSMPDDTILILTGVAKQATDVMLSAAADFQLTKLANAVACLSEIVRLAVASSKLDPERARGASPSGGSSHNAALTSDNGK